MASKGRREEWERLLSAERVDCGAEGGVGFENVRPGDSRSAYEVDYSRVVFSSSFRRLARKTQVLPFADGGTVHNRLTHSIEVASVCHTLAREAGEFLAARGDIPGERIAHVDWCMQAAGLAHDIGNPAYGHSGEEAIQKWAEERGESLGGELFWNDFRVFDGNAQAFRLLSRNDMEEDVYYRLTLATLGAFVKHPRVASSFGPGDAGAKKLAAFTSEEEIFAKAWERLGLARGGRFLRHPLSYLTGAADDICYSILDFEDAAEAGILDAGEVGAIFRKFLSPKHASESAGKPLQWLRGVAVRDLIEETLGAFAANYDAIMEGEFEGELAESLAGGAREAFAEINAKYAVLISHHRKAVSGAGCRALFDGLLERCFGFLECVPREGEAPEFGELPRGAAEIVELAWGECRYGENRRRGKAWWAHRALDFVSSLTDDRLNAVAGPSAGKRKGKES